MSDSTPLLQQRQEEIVEEFAYFEDWMEKYEYLIELGKELKPFDEADRTDDNIIRGCQSRVWLAAQRSPDGTLLFGADSDAIITRGLVALVIRALNNLPPEVIAGADLWFVQRIGLDTHLSPTRANGLLSMVQQMKHYGIAFQAR
ncbi:MAG TPA: Fe-S metabolism protein SufE [Flavobacteriales bacterium]|jgi:cysteine desulfuration protein SufE|nr:SufE family protein [Flavobacteriales bacterium]MDO7741986.1 SufE family protein [Flavobacteriales bacterium]HAW72302.1 Fe-S metabolism protein SufE [Flavobacteriales bacterium]|tara:strand:- start:304 stop:738 length:435 start_codon:yes stop_codon:yes gene_type:complete